MIRRGRREMRWDEGGPDPKCYRRDLDSLLQVRRLHRGPTVKIGRGEERLGPAHQIRKLLK